MSAHVFRQTPSPFASATRFTTIRNLPDSAALGNLTILASTTTGEVAGPTKMPAAPLAAAITLLRTRSPRI